MLTFMCKTISNWWVKWDTIDINYNVRKINKLSIKRVNTCDLLFCYSISRDYGLLNCSSKHARALNLSVFIISSALRTEIYILFLFLILFEVLLHEQ